MCNKCSENHKGDKYYWCPCECHNVRDRIRRGIKDNSEEKV